MGYRYGRKVVGSAGSSPAARTNFVGGKMNEASNLDLLAIGTLIVALLALARPEIANALGKWTNEIDLYPATRFEIGFSDFGPTVGINGSLRAVGNEQLIKSIKLQVIRNRDNATHSFEWTAFRKINLIQQDKSEVDAASAFVVRKNDSKNVNILFHDVETQAMFKDEVLDLRNVFFKHCQANKIRLDLLDGDQWWGVNKQFEGENKEYSLRVYNTINNAFYWEGGKYEVEVTISTDRPSKTFRSFFNFHLSPEDSDSLKLNVICLMNAACYQPAYQFNFAHVRLVKV